MTDITGSVRDIVAFLDNRKSKNYDNITINMLAKELKVHSNAFKNVATIQILDVIQTMIQRKILIEYCVVQSGFTNYYLRVGDSVDMENVWMAVVNGQHTNSSIDKKIDELDRTISSVTVNGLRIQNTLRMELDAVNLTEEQIDIIISKKITNKLELKKHVPDIKRKDCAEILRVTQKHIADMLYATSE